MEINRKKLVTAVIALAILAVLIVFGVYAANRRDKDKNSNLTFPKVGVRVDAAKGKLIEGFPRELVIDSNAKIQESYSIPVESLNQKTSVLSNTRTVKQNYEDYLKYLTDFQYTIVNKELMDDKASIYAYRPGESDVQVYIYKVDNTTTNFSVTYLQKK